MDELKTQVFNARKCELERLLPQIQAKVEALCNRDPEKLNWAQVGDMARVIDFLRELREA